MPPKARLRSCPRFDSFEVVRLHEADGRSFLTYTAAKAHFAYLAGEGLEVGLYGIDLNEKPELLKRTRGFRNVL